MTVEDDEGLCELVRAIAVDGGDVEQALRGIMAAVGRRRTAVEGALRCCRDRLARDPDDGATARAVQMLDTALRSGVFLADAQ